MLSPRQRTIESLVAELGRAVNALYLADREAPDAIELPEARRLLTEVTEHVTDIARSSEVDLAAVARTWELIALAHDAALAARAASAEAGAQAEPARALRQQAAEQRDRAAAHAARIRRWWARALPRRTPPSEE